MKLRFRYHIESIPNSKLIKLLTYIKTPFFPKGIGRATKGLTQMFVFDVAVLQCVQLAQTSVLRFKKAYLHEKMEQQKQDNHII